MPGIKYQKAWADRIRTASNGRLNIEVYEANALMGWNETLDGLTNNAIQVDIMWPNQWVGRNSAFTLLSAWPFGMDHVQTQIWWFSDGGLDMLNQVYAPYNVKAQPCLTVAAEIGAWSKVPYPDLASMKGKSYRMGAGPAAVALQELGVNVVSLAAPECYGALDRGVVDLLEYGQWNSDRDLRLYEVASYLQMPAWHQSCLTDMFEFSLTAWNELPEDLQTIVEAECYRYFQEFNWFYKGDNVAAMETILDEGVEITRLSSEDLGTLKTLCSKVMEEEADKNPLYKEIWESQKQTIEKWNTFMEFSELGKVLA